MEEYKQYYFPNTYEQELTEKMTPGEYSKHLACKSLDRAFN
ncbi:MAG: hypothetical protein NTU63_04245 [Candidatus Pacearchaeota archaeon]|nr:hypothetical protein [Candidatus Pacearchaeota archaeon]